MAKFQYSNQQVEEVSNFIQTYLKKNNLSILTADQCAQLLADNGILENSLGPKQGFNFREMLRQGREGKIGKMPGVYQIKPGARWVITIY